MLKKWLLFLLLQLNILLPIKVLADYPQGGAIWLLHACEAGLSNTPYRWSPQDIYAGACFGYLTATIEIYYSAATAANQVSVCPPGNATNEQYARIVVKYLKNHPEDLNQVGYAQAMKALQQAWPCKQPGKV